ncbi:MAG: hypothetical protein J5501_02905 [Ruminococcus sp.]|nr:hypothetical protein [Ruminococcus sp.]
MKKTLLLIAAGALLTGCGVNDPAKPEMPAEAAAFTAEATEVEYTEAETETEKTEAQTEEEIAEKTGPVKVPMKEQEALDKLCAKYGKEFKVAERNVQNEYWDEKPDILNVWYDLEDEEGRTFKAMIKENLDTVVYDGYAYVLHEKELYDETAAYIRSLMPEGKLWFGINSGVVPFETPANMNFDDFSAMFAANDGKINMSVIITGETEISDELQALQSGHTDIRPAELGYSLSINYYRVPQDYYDSLDDVVYGEAGIDRSRLERLTVG